MNKIELDVSPLLAPNKKFAVQVHTEEDAVAFLSFMMQNYPQKMVNWSLGSHNFGHYSTTCYSPWLNVDGNRMKYANVEFYLEHGYEVVQFEDLVYCEITESDEPLDFLFGGSCGG